jgi:hypothetical protein
MNQKIKSEIINKLNWSRVRIFKGRKVAIYEPGTHLLALDIAQEERKKKDVNYERQR